MGTLNAKFRFNKAGQGCFYTGWLRNETGCFSMAYDCGTHSSHEYLKNEIGKFHVDLKIRSKGKLDLLIISHFDDDHVNELSELLKGISEVEYIILPYLTPLLRLGVYLSHGETGGDFQSFLTDPVGFLTTRGAVVKNIIFIDGDDLTGDNFPADNTPEPPSGEDFFSCNHTELKPIDKATKTEYKNDDRVIFLKDKGRFFIGNVWEFYFYNKPLSEDILLAFFAEMHGRFPALYNGNILTQTELQAIFDSTRIAEIKDLYRHSLENRNLNYTSLIVYHGPVYRNAKDIDGYYYKNRHGYWREFHESAQSTLLMGDIYLTGLIFPRYINTKREKIGVLQIPHHGSETLWDFTVLSALINPWIIAVINFGLGNTHKHPRQTVIDDIKSHGWKIKLNHQLKAFKYFVRFSY